MRSTRFRLAVPLMRRPLRTGFTLVELIVAVAILGTLLAILLPAVQFARAASRANACRSNLHQVGVAIANCEQVTGVIPTWVRRRRVTPINGDLWPLLPYLDQQPLWERLEAGDGGHFEFVEVLICPDDAYAWRLGGQVNYAFNGGTTFRDFDPEGSGILSSQKSRRLREIQDGLSATAMLSERLLGAAESVSPEEGRRETGRYLWWTEQGFQGQGQELRAAEACRTRMTTPLPIYGAVGSMSYGLLTSTGYSHLLPPNHRGCHNATEPFDAEAWRTLIPPSSNHAGGVHVLMCDGQVRFVSESIGDAPWRAAGTRAGHESERLP